MDPVTGVLAFMVSVLAVLQGWQMIKKKNNPNNTGSSSIGLKLDIIVNQLGRMEQRLNAIDRRLEDVWDKIQK